MAFLTGVGAVAAGASAIIAWASRADALQARKSADEAQADAKDIAKKSADALDRANRLAEKHFEERSRTEKRHARAGWGALLRGWAASRIIPAALPTDEDVFRLRRVKIAEVSEARLLLDESTAIFLQHAVHAIAKATEASLAAIPPENRTQHTGGASDRMFAIEKLIETWIADPAGESEEFDQYVKLTLQKEL